MPLYFWFEGNDAKAGDDTHSIMQGEHSCCHENFDVTIVVTDITNRASYCKSEYWNPCFRWHLDLSTGVEHFTTSHKF